MSIQDNKKTSKLFKIILSIILLISVLSIAIVVFKYTIASGIEKDKNRDEVSYDESFFDNLQELNIAEIYINVQKDGKWGYIDTKGKTVIEFKYDYATPFKKIEKNNKKFDVALVVEGDSTAIILKDERKVLSYKTETDNNDYDWKCSELLGVCAYILGQKLEFFEHFEVVPPSQDGYAIIYRYEDDSQNQTDNIAGYIRDDTNSLKEIFKIEVYKYDYTSEYDIVITKTLKEGVNLENIKTESNLYNHKYELVKKTNENSRIVLECNNIQYDEDYMEIFKNGYIPFYDVENENQGWYTPDGNKMNLHGKYRVLDFIDDYILIKNYENDRIFFINYQGQIVSPQYKEIYVLNDIYIVKNENNKCSIINKNFERLFAKEYDIIDPKLYSIGLFVCTNVKNDIVFNSQNYAENIDYEIIDLRGNTISTDFYQQVYPYVFTPRIDYRRYETGKYEYDKELGGVQSAEVVQFDKSVPDYEARYDEFIEELFRIKYYFTGYEYYPNDKYI